MPDQIHLTFPDGTVRSVDLKPGMVSIGRAPENDIQLDHPSISRSHARLEFDGAHWQIVDLNSTNGVFIENVRLQPNNPQVWLPGESLQIGEVRLGIESAVDTKPVASTATKPHQASAITGAQSGVTLARSDGSPIQPDQLQYSPGQKRIGALIETPNISVAPGNNVSCTLLLFNFGSDTDNFRIKISGLPPQWMLRWPELNSLPANGRKAIQLTFRPPRSPQSRAGRYRVNVEISSQKIPSEAVELRLTLTITAFAQFASRIEPAHLDPGDMGQIIVHNMGNLPETFTIYWESPERELVFDPPQRRITLQPDQEASVEFRPTVAQPPYYGKNQPYIFIAHVTPASSSAQAHPGEYIGRALIPVWAPALVASLCLVMVCALGVLFNQMTAPERRARETENANQTAVAQMVVSTAMANTATAGAFQNANQATIQAATATAAWLIADSDGDGLTNSEEKQLFTKPEIPDTDQDGLLDGEEVKNWKTNPLIPDTDGDGLTDGEEIKRKTNPLNRDTDGDGLEDSIDPDPLKASTPTLTLTPTISPTPEATATQTQTPTPTVTASPLPTSTDLSISITNNQSVAVPGANIVYTIVVQNTGVITVTNIQVNDQFPPELHNITWNCTTTAGSLCQTANNSGNINTLVNLAAGGRATFVVNSTIDPNAEGTLFNQASVAPPAGITDTNNLNNQHSDSDPLQPKVNFALSKTDQRDTIAPGEAVTYTISLENAGPSSVAGVIIRDTFPDQIEGLTWICAGEGGAVCSTTAEQAGNIDTRVDLPPGGNIIIAASGMVRVDASDVITNTVTLRSPISPENSVTRATDTTTIVPVADLAVSVSAPPVISRSSTVTYTVQITNTGPSIATNLILHDQIPLGTTFQIADPDIYECTLDEGMVTCKIGALAPGANLELKIVIRTQGVSGTIINHVEVLADEADPNKTNNVITTDVLIN